MKHRAAGFSLVEVMIVIAISAVLIVAVWMVIASVVQQDDNTRARLEMQLEAAGALRKISDLLKMAGPTGNVNAPALPTDYPVFALDQPGGGFGGQNLFINTCKLQSNPGGPPVTNDNVAHLAPVTTPANKLVLDPDGYYGTSNEIAFKIPRPAPFYVWPGAPNGLPNEVPRPPNFVTDNAVDNTGAPVDSTGAVTWGVTPNLYQYYMGSYNGQAGYVPCPNSGPATADRQTDVYAIVLVPTTTVQKDASGNPVAGPNQLELREYSSTYSVTTPRSLIRKTILAYNVERIVFNFPLLPGQYYPLEIDPLTGDQFQDATLGMNQLRVTIWMWKNQIDKKASSQINAIRVMQSMTVNLRSVGSNQLGS